MSVLLQQLSLTKFHVFLKLCNVQDVHLPGSRVNFRYKVVLGAVYPHLINLLVHSCSSLVKHTEGAF